MSGHHLILGQMIGYLTGESITDTHDERYRQALAKLLVEEKGYQKSDILPRRKLIVAAGDNCAQIQIDLTVVIEDAVAMIIRYGPGSLVTRHRPALAASRVVAAYQIPIVVVTNGLDADVLQGKTGSILSKGLDSIPGRQNLLDRCRAHTNEPISPKRNEAEQRILYAFEVDGSCPCDDTICRF